MTYRHLTDDDQVQALRPTALAAAAAFGLDVARVDLVAHAYNTTFAVTTTDGQRYALRVNTNSHSTPANVVAQQSWQQAIAVETDVVVPEPLRTPDGAWYVEVANEVFGRQLLVTVASWLDGPDAVELGAVVSRELGRTMALLHRQSASWSLPKGATMPVFDTPLFGDGDLLDSAPGLSAEQRGVIGRARDEAAQAFAQLYAGAAVQPLHADLHGGNLKWDGARLAVFDFDDCGLGHPVLDLAISTFYLRGGDPGAERALREGYADVAPLPEVEAALFEALLAARQLLLANSLLDISTAELRGEAEAYLDVTVDRLRHWLVTGLFTRILPA